MTESKLPRPGDHAATLRLQTDGVIWRRVVDDVVVLDTRTNHYLNVNAVGAEVWEHLAHGASRAELESALRAAHPQQADRIGGDLTAFLEDLDEHGLLVQEPGPG